MTKVKNLIIYTAVSAIVMGLSVAAFGAKASAKTTNPVTLTSAQATGVNTVTINATVQKNVTAKDGKYYLCYVTPKVANYKKAIASIPKTSNTGQKLTYKLNIYDAAKKKTHREYMIMKYAIGVKGSDGKMKLVSNAKFVKNPEKAAENKKPYLIPKTKKGIQSGVIDEVVDSGAHIGFCNLYISQVVTNGNTKYVYNGKTYYFNDLNYYRYYCEVASQKGIQVTMQIMMDNTPKTKSLTYSRKPNAGGPLHGFRINDTPQREKIEAIFCYLAEVFGSDERYVSNWILGNEVEMGPETWYMGPGTKRDKFIDNYARTYRTLYNAVKSVRASSRLFICLGHCWTIKGGGSGTWKGKGIVTNFAKKQKSLQANVSWNLAFHPHPDNLANPAFWNDRASMTRNSASSPKITMKNLSALTKWIRKTYGKNTRVIVSEIGFNSAASKKKQAAALALAYDIVACDPQVDGLTIRAYKDDPNDKLEGRQLYFGIKGRKAMTIYKKMDTTKWSSATSSLLKSQVGSNWKKKVPGFSGARLYKFYKNY